MRKIGLKASKIAPKIPLNKYFNTTHTNDSI